MSPVIVYFHALVKSGTKVVLIIITVVTSIQHSDLANSPSLQGSPSLPDPETKSNKKNGIYIHYMLVIYV